MDHWLHGTSYPLPSFIHVNSCSLSCVSFIFLHLFPQSNLPPPWPAMCCVLQSLFVCLFVSPCVSNPVVLKLLFLPLTDLLLCAMLSTYHHHNHRHQSNYFSTEDGKGARSVKPPKQGKSVPSWRETVLSPRNEAFVLRPPASNQTSWFRLRTKDVNANQSNCSLTFLFSFLYDNWNK